ncbi:hydroxypyruvate isomerase [Salinisphaera hydrothermalis C41B8]|uniref:Hydroxypyruvate isomerase n=2 Tax=Salinisphaera TaxID=180541 RepID=A0A084IN86_SALHC|nr:hydroxypyruvate isomerase [Salinisphaera hydrothermalis C41B8]
MPGRRPPSNRAAVPEEFAMPRFAANLSLMFNEVEFMARFERAAHAGFAGVEFLFPYAWAADDIAGALEAHRLTQVLFNAPPGDWDGGERGLAALPGREAEFRAGLDDVLRYAERLDCRRVHVMAGNVADLAAAEAMHATYLDNLAHAADRFAAYGITALIEPINSRDMPHYFLTRQAAAHEIVAEVGADNIAVQMDFYHAQIMDGDIWTTFRAGRDNIGHIQIAGVPERNEPDDGELNYPWLFERLDAAGYNGWVGCEYIPRDDTESGLGWFAPWRRR